MRKWILRKLGMRQSSKGQTTAEYAIIVALVAVSSIAVILIFGNQIRALIAGSSERMATDEEVQVEDKSSEAGDNIEGSITEFK